MAWRRQGDKPLWLQVEKILSLMKIIDNAHKHIFRHTTNTTILQFKSLSQWNTQNDWKLNISLRKGQFRNGHSLLLKLEDPVDHTKYADMPHDEKITISDMDILHAKIV